MEGRGGGCRILGKVLIELVDDIADVAFLLCVDERRLWPADTFSEILFLEEAVFRQNIHVCSFVAEHYLNQPDKLPGNHILVLVVSVGVLQDRLVYLLLLPVQVDESQILFLQSEAPVEIGEFLLLKRAYFFLQPYDLLLVYCVFIGAESLILFSQFLDFE